MKQRSAMPLVIFAVCMVSYSGPMVKGALNAGGFCMPLGALPYMAGLALYLAFAGEHGRADAAAMEGKD